MTKHRLVKQCPETPSTGDRTTTSRLPETLLWEQVRRFAVCAGVGAGLWTYGLAMDSFVRPLTLDIPIPPANVAIELAAIVFSLLTLLYVRFAPYEPQTKADAGLPYLVVNAIGVALLNTWSRPVDVATPIPTVSWNAIVILIGAMIIPSTPRKMLVASLASATMDPLAVWLASLRGLPVPSLIDTLVFFAPNYACAVVATLPTRVLHRLGRRLRQAQEMGSYHLVELLGRGGMGEVWRARHRLLARDAAIKLVRPELLGASREADARRMLDRFEHEAQATAALSSPHTIRIFDFGVTEEDTFYYVMELLAGRDLESLVREFGPVPAERALFLLHQVCHSLADAHARGLVHRDVTPSNIYVCRMGLDYDFVKVLDFGLVKSDDDFSIDETLGPDVHVTTGTPAFMAPEVILGGRVDQRADVYALGCVAYYLLTGQRVFEGETPMAMFIQHLQAPPVPPSQRSELPIPREVDALVLECLAKNPADRPQGAAEVLARLQTIHIRERWDNQSATAWWRRHLLDLTGPLASADAETAEFRLAPA